MRGNTTTNRSNSLYKLFSICFHADSANSVAPKSSSSGDNLSCGNKSISPSVSSSSASSGVGDQRPTLVFNQFFCRSKHEVRKSENGIRPLEGDWTRKGSRREKVVVPRFSKKLDLIDKPPIDSPRLSKQARSPAEVRYREEICREESSLGLD